LLRSIDGASPVVSLFVTEWYAALIF